MAVVSKIAIVIVNYKTPTLVKECLASLRQAALELNLAVFIGDADSQDGSVAIISDYITQEGLTWATCFDIGRNGGFAYGNNAVLAKYVLPIPEFEFVHFLNPDTYIRPGAVHALVTFLKEHPNVGIAGSRLENPDGSPRSYGFRAPAPWREFFRGVQFGPINRRFPEAEQTIENLQENRNVDWVTGASFMTRRAMLDEIGLMDDGYFLYFEETDLMTRARKAGFAVWHVVASRVVHLAGQSTGVRTKNADDRPQRLSPHWLASRSRYMRKHYKPLGALRANICFLAGDVLYRVICKVTGRPIIKPPYLWRDYLKRRPNVLE